MKMKSIFLSALIALSMFGFSSEAKAEYPNKPITIYCPYAAGGDTDLSARVWADFASKELGQPVLVVNKVGGGGLAGTVFAANQKADGYSLFIGQPGSNVVVPILAPKSGISRDSFDYLARFIINIPGAVVRADSHWNSLEDFKAEALKNPNKFIYSGPSATSSNNIFFRSWLIQNNIKVKAVEYNSGAESATSVLGGHGDISFVYGPNYTSMVDGKKLKLLAVGIKDEKYPDVPTMNELGYKGNYYGWSGIIIPKGAPQEVKDKIIAVTQKIAKDPVFVQAVKNLGFIPDNTVGQEFVDAYNSQYDEVEKVLTELGLVK